MCAGDIFLRKAVSLLQTKVLYLGRKFWAGHEISKLHTRSQFLRSRGTTPVSHEQPCAFWKKSYLKKRPNLLQRWCCSRDIRTLRIGSNRQSFDCWIYNYSARVEVHRLRRFVKLMFLKRTMWATSFCCVVSFYNSGLFLHCNKILKMLAVSVDCVVFEGHWAFLFAKTSGHPATLADLTLVLTFQAVVRGLAGDE
jgi:hypothetical protein